MDTGGGAVQTLAGRWVGVGDAVPASSQRLASSVLPIPMSDVRQRRHLVPIAAFKIRPARAFDHAPEGLPVKKIIFCSPWLDFIRGRRRDRRPGESKPFSSRRALINQCLEASTSAGRQRPLFRGRIGPRERAGDAPALLNPSSTRHFFFILGADPRTANTAPRKIGDAEPIFINVGSASQTVDQHSPTIGSTSSLCWDTLYPSHPSSHVHDTLNQCPSNRKTTSVSNRKCWATFKQHCQNVRNIARVIKCCLRDYHIMITLMA